MERAWSLSILGEGGEAPLRKQVIFLRALVLSGVQSPSCVPECPWGDWAACEAKPIIALRW